MAEAFFSELAPEHEAFSAGTHVKGENEGDPISKITEKVILCMQEVGHSVGDKSMNLLTAEMVGEADRVVAITPQETLPNFLKELSKLEVWDIPDAGGSDLDFHRKVRELVKERVAELVVSL